jgi:hypothetical protein
MSRIKGFSRTPVLALAFALAIIMSLAAVRPASAATVDYTTTGVFTSSGTNVSTSGTSTVTYGDLTSDNNDTPTIISLGSLTLAGTTTSSFSDSFTLTVDQLSPSTGSATLSSTLAGTLTVNGSKSSSSVKVTFASSSFTIGGVKYTLLTNPIDIPNPNSNGGTATIQAEITSAVPVPAAVWGGMGLFGLLLVGKFRRAVLA